MPKLASEQYALRHRFLIQTWFDEPDKAAKNIQFSASLVEDPVGDILRITRGILTGDGKSEHHPHHSDIMKTGESEVYVGFMSHTHIHIVRYDCAKVTHKPVVNLDANTAGVALEAFEYKVKWRGVAVIPRENGHRYDATDPLSVWGGEFPDLENLFEQS